MAAYNYKTPHKKEPFQEDSFRDLEICDNVIRPDKLSSNIILICDFCVFCDIHFASFCGLGKGFSHRIRYQVTSCWEQQPANHFWGSDCRASPEISRKQRNLRSGDEAFLFRSIWSDSNISAVTYIILYTYKLCVWCTGNAHTDKNKVWWNAYTINVKQLCTCILHNVN